MPVTQYIGSRYVPIFADPIAWSDQKEYEPLTIVTHDGNSYTSKQFVPVGIDISNESFWALTGNYNAQIELYRRETAAVAQDIDAVEAALPIESFSADSTVKSYIDDSCEAIESVLPIDSFSADNTIKLYIDNSREDILSRYHIDRIYKNRSEMISDDTLSVDMVVVVLQDVADNSLNINLFVVVESVTSDNQYKARCIVSLDNGLYAVMLSTNTDTLPMPASIETIARMCEVGSTYVATKDHMSYGSPSYEWLDRISCSVVAVLVAMGIPYEDSPYITRNGNKIYSTGRSGYGYPLYTDWLESNADTLYPSGILAQWGCQRGLCFIPDYNFNNLRGGDIVFFARRDTSQDTDFFMRITHCEMFLSPRSPNMFNQGGVTATNYRYVTVNGGHTSGYPVRFDERNLNHTDTGQIPVLAMRLPNSLSHGQSKMQRPATLHASGGYMFPKPTTFDTDLTHVLSVCGEVLPSDSCYVALVDAANNEITRVSFDGANEYKTFMLNHAIAGASGNFHIEVANGILRNVSYVYDSICTSIVENNLFVLPSSIDDMDKLRSYFASIGLFEGGNFSIQLRCNSTPPWANNNGVGNYLVTRNVNTDDIIIRSLHNTQNQREIVLHESATTLTETYYRLITFTSV